MPPLRIISWNLQKGYRQEMLEAQFPQVLALSPDFLCLQEVLWEARVVLDRVLLHMKDKYRLIQLPLPRKRGKSSKDLAMTSLLVRSDWKDEEIEFVPFEKDEDRKNTKGLLCGRFSRGEESISVGSVHQPAQAWPGARRVSARIIRDFFAKRPGAAVVAGDFNTGFPGENQALARILSERFTWLTPHVGPTCFWRRLESTMNTYTRIGQFVGRWLDIRLPIDHAFATRELAQNMRVSARKLPEFEASDHLPVVVDFEPQ
jgi:endonuclease/exonuclease/phosphatase family metal-dependent hydrolase